MTLFMVERALGGISMQALAGAQAAAIGAAKDSTARGQKVSYVRSMFAPDDGRCFCLFEAERAEDVPRRQRHRRTAVPSASPRRCSLIRPRAEPGVRAASSTARRR